MNALVPESDGDEVEVTLSVSLPAATVVKAISSGTENTVSTLDILAFKSESGVETFEYRKAVSLSSVTTTGGVSTVKAELVSGSYNLVLIANASAILDTYLPGLTNGGAGTDKATMLAGLKVSLGGITDYIPMWGESGAVTVSSGITIGTVELLRMMARIDVINGASGFTLSDEVSLYNYYTEGRLVPTMLGTLTTVSGSTTTEGPQGYAVSSTSLEGAIYTFESDKTKITDGSGEVLHTSTCLVIKGTYNDIEGWYRINFAQLNSVNDEYEYFNLKRNHHYQITLKAVEGVGYADKTQAYMSRPVNIEYDVQITDDGLNSTVEDGQYGLAVSEDHIILTRNETFSGIIVSTTYDVTSYEGWKAKVTTGADWLHLADGSGTNTGLIDVSSQEHTGMFCYRADENTGTSARTGYITVTSGRMTRTITITQNIYAYQANEADAANCYMVTPGGQAVKLPIEATGGDAGIKNGTRSGVSTVLRASTTDGGAPLQAGFVWNDCKFGLSNKSVVHRILIDDANSDGAYNAYDNLIVIPGPATGNAVISVTNSAGVVGWSWHIWNTGYSAAVSGTEGLMDRNLGALLNTREAGLSSLGLLYQWGRKDPFPGSATLTMTPPNGEEPAIYNASGSAIPVTKTLVAESNNLSNAIANPVTFYYRSGSSFSDWFTSSTSTQNGNLWTNNKTLYDPCPAGWKVPPNEIWNGLGTASFPWSDYGLTNANYGGWYPAAGSRDCWSGNLESVGQRGYYWKASTSYNSGTDLVFYNTPIVNPNSQAQRASGFSIRCIQEQSANM